MFTKEEILEKIKGNNAEWFGNIDYSDHCKLCGKIQLMDQRYYGDGNERFVTVHFVDHGIYVSVEGYYSSYGSSSWDTCYLSVPYTHTEIRFNRVDG